MAWSDIKQANSGKCPHCGVEVTVLGWYRERPNGTWVFSRAECPIIENSRLPVWEQCERYKYLRCLGQIDCSLYSAFQPTITPDI